MYSVLTVFCTLLLLTVSLSNVTAQTSWTFESNVAAARIGAKVARCDINNDGKLDLVTTGVTGVYVFYSNSSGLFGTSESRIVIPLASIVTDGLGLDCSDLNADGYADVIVGNWTGNPGYVHIYNGSASGISLTPTTLTWVAGQQYFGAALITGDFNGDGKKDLAVGAYGMGRVVLYYGLGASGLNPTYSGPTILNPNVLTYGQTLATCDLSNDGSSDLIVGARSMNSSRGQVFIYNNVGGVFTLAHNSSGAAASAFYGYDAGCGDINGDGNKDVAILSQGDRLLYIYYGTGNVLTLPKTPSLVIPLIDAARSISVFDHNLDGFADIIAGFNGVNRVQVWYGGPTLSSSSSAGFTFTGPTGTGWSVAGVGNLDGVGMAEIAFGSFAYTNGQSTEGLVGVVYNPPASPTPSSSPSSTPSASSSPSASASPTSSATPSSSATPTASATPSASVTPTATASASASATPSATATASATPSSSVTPTSSVSPSASPSRSPSKVPSSAPAASSSSSPSASSVPSASSTPSVLPSPLPGATCAQCTSDNDCSNGRGVCIASSVGSYCSCLSGFGGCDCSQEPSAVCANSFSEVDALKANFQASATVDYEYPTLFVSVEANLEENAFNNEAPYSMETLIYFGSSPSAYPECSFPNGGATWSDLPATSSCTDVYQATMSWTYAKDNCGFAAVAGTKNYTQTITVVRKYNLNGVITRTEKNTRHLSVNFPSEIEVTDSNVTVSFPAANAFAALTAIEYDPDNLVWTVTVQTSVNNPYSLSAPVASVLSGNLPQRSPGISVSGCTSVGTSCVQTLTYTYPQGGASDACEGLFGTDLHTFALQCSTPSCPGSNLLNISLTLNTGNACPATDDINFSEASLNSYSSSSLVTLKDSFAVNDVVFFGASVQSTEGLISSRTLKANSVCFQPPNGACFYPAYTVLPATNGKQPVFKVDLTAPENAAYFSAVTSPTSFSVKATVVVDFAGAKSIHKKKAAHSQTIQTVTTAVIGAEASSSAVASPAIMLIVMLLASMYF